MLCNIYICIHDSLLGRNCIDSYRQACLIAFAIAHFGTWGAYPYALQHHLSRACIVCLAMFERAKNPNVSIHSCFQLDPIPEKWTWVSSKQLATGEW